MILWEAIKIQKIVLGQLTILWLKWVERIIQIIKHFLALDSIHIVLEHHRSVSLIKIQTFKIF
jgi:hypothetical protein